MANIDNRTSDTTITGSSNADNIKNQATNVVINANNGNDTIINGSEEMIGLFRNMVKKDDNNSTLVAASNITIDAGAGNDLIYNHGGFFQFIRQPKTAILRIMSLQPISVTFLIWAKISQ